MVFVLPVGRPSAELREAWLETVAALLCRGVVGVAEIADRTGLSPRTVRRWRAEVWAGWGAGLDQSMRRATVHGLFMEARSVAAGAWQVYAEAESVRAQLAALKTVLDANRRAAAVYGLDQTAEPLPPPPLQAPQLPELSKAEFRTIGREVAKVLSRRASE